MKDMHYRLKNSAVAVLIFCAGIADAFTLIPFVGDLVGPIFWLVASVYLWKKGCGFKNFGTVATRIISTIGEMVPGVQEFPLIVAGTLAVVAMIRIEDKTGIGIPEKSPVSTTFNQGGVRRAKNTDADATPKPLNDGGYRAPNGGLSE